MYPVNICSVRNLWPKFFIFCFTDFLIGEQGELLPNAVECTPSKYYGQPVNPLESLLDAQLVFSRGVPTIRNVMHWIVLFLLFIIIIIIIILCIYYYTWYILYTIDIGRSVLA